MIFQVILEVLHTGYAWLVNLLPTGHLPAEMSSSLQSLVAYGKQLDAMISVRALLICIGLVLMAEFGILVWKFVKYILGLIRGAHAPASQTSNA